VIKLLYRIDEVAEILGVSRRTVYYLLEEGKLIGHNDKPEVSGIRILGSSIEEYVKRYQLPRDYFKKREKEDKIKRRIISKGVE